MSNLPLNFSSSSPNILLVKLSSLGDVLHNLPIVWDLRARLPDARIDWVVEEGYVHLLEPLLSKGEFKGIDRIIPFGLRRWKKNLFKLDTWKQFFSFKAQLQAVQYNYVIETQGLLKSALVCTLAKKSQGAVVAGLANATQYSGYEPIARWFYNHSVQVPIDCHAVDRSRQVMASALDWPLISRTTTPAFYAESFSNFITEKNITDLRKPYVLCFHSTAREAKRWSNQNWITLGQALASRGYQVVLPWGNLSERAVSDELAREIPGALVPQAFSIEDAFSVITHAALTIGVDTGLTHLAAVLGKPTIEIYCDSPRWKTEGYWAKNICNVGDLGAPPRTSEVIDTSMSLLP
jgi:heptosyltransferase-1